MSNKPGIVVLALVLMGLVAPMGTVFATNGHDNDKHTNRGISWERLAAKEVESYQQEEDRLEKRLERLRLRIEKHLERSREHLCDRLQHIEDRSGIDLVMPSYCEDVVPPAPPTLTLSATPDTVVQGASSTLSWVTTNATTCIASNGWSGARATSGAQSIAPVATTTYTLACGNGVATATQSVLVGVTTTPPPPVPLPTVDLSAASSTVIQGASTTLNWTSTHAATCVASNGWSGARATTGAKSIAPSATTTYTLACSNTTGTTSDSVTVNVVVPSVPSMPLLPTVDLSANPLSVTVGGTSTLSWNTSNATYCEASNGWVGAQATTSGVSIVTVSATTTYTLACGNVTGTTTDSVEVVALPAPVPVLGKVVLSELIYDLDTGQGSEPDNEWLEVYNGTNAPVDLAGWKLRDGTATDTIATSSPLVVPAGGRAIIIATSTTAGFWAFDAGALVINLNSANGIGNGFANSNDVIRLFNAAGTEVDAMSYGGNVVAFDSTGLTAPAGSSLARVPVTTDTDTKNDWVVLATPTPGS